VDHPEDGPPVTRTSKDYFAKLYASAEDPWGFETRWYEQRKYDLTLAALPEPRYLSGFEPGCSIGVLSQRLAPRCDRLLCAEQMPAVAEVAAGRLAHLPNVEVRALELPESWPEESFDLLVLSELCYYFDEVELRELLGVARASLLPGATVIAVHWRGATDYPLSGDRAHAVIGSVDGFAGVVHHREPEFVLDTWRYAAE
jgi:Nodulation protein S (NodS)